MTYAELKRRARCPQRDPGSWAETTAAAACCYGQQSQSGRPVVVDPYGGLSQRAARQQYRQFGQPLGALFGFAPQFGEGPRGQRRAQRFEERLAALRESNAPLAQFAEQARSFLPSVFGQAQDIGQRIASQAPEVFETLRGQIQNALGQLPGIQQAAAQQVGQAQGQVGSARGQLGTAEQFLRESQNPIASQALYQDALRQSLEGARGSAAARGLLDAGAAQAMESEMGRDLASQFAARRFQEQQQALGGAQGALGGVQGALGGVQQALGAQAGLLPLGAQLAGAEGQALQQFADAMQRGYGLPLEALGQVFQQFAAFQNPALALAQLAAPTVAQRTSGRGFNVI